MIDKFTMISGLESKSESFSLDLSPSLSTTNFSNSKSESKSSKKAQVRVLFSSPSLISNISSSLFFNYSISKFINLVTKFCRNSAGFKLLNKLWQQYLYISTPFASVNQRCRSSRCRWKLIKMLRCHPLPVLPKAKRKGSEIQGNSKFKIQKSELNFILWQTN